MLHGTIWDVIQCCRIFVNVSEVYLFLLGHKSNRFVKRTSLYPIFQGIVHTYDKDPVGIETFFDQKLQLQDTKVVPKRPKMGINGQNDPTLKKDMKNLGYIFETS